MCRDAGFFHPAQCFLRHLLTDRFRALQHLRHGWEDLFIGAVPALLVVGRFVTAVDVSKRKTADAALCVLFGGEIVRSGFTEEWACSCDLSGEQRFPRSVLSEEHGVFSGVKCEVKGRTKTIERMACHPLSDLNQRSPGYWHFDSFLQEFDGSLTGV